MIFWLRLNIVAVAVTLGRRELKTLRSALVVAAGLIDRQECLHKGAGEMGKYPKCFGHFLELTDDCYGCEFSEECEQETEDVERDLEDMELVWKKKGVLLKNE